jgi:FKBP-type peptidyl-prolyl cis-trans isomerase FklB
MKYMVLAVLNVMFLWGVCSAGEKLDLTDEKIRGNYSVGYQVGGDFKRQGIEIDGEMLLKGIQDALAGNEPLMTTEEIRTTLVDLQKKATAAQETKNREEAENNRLIGKAFLAENGKKEGVVTLPSGLQYKVIKEGSGRMPVEKDTVTVHYRGVLIDGTEFDSSHSRNQTATFQANQVIAGWKEALLLMKEGSKWQLFIPSELAYGEAGAGSKIRPNSTLIFDIELISVIGN